MKKSPVCTRLERLEQRRHLSASYLVGCNCSACSGKQSPCKIGAVSEPDFAVAEYGTCQ